MVTLQSVKEEIAHNLLEQLDSVIESRDDELIEKWFSSLTEEQIMILEEEEPWFDWKGMIPGMNTYRQYKQGNLGANWDTAKAVGFDALNVASLIPAVKGARLAAQGLNTVARNTAAKLSAKRAAAATVTPVTKSAPLFTPAATTASKASVVTPAERLAASKVPPSTLQSRAATTQKPPVAVKTPPTATLSQPIKPNVPAVTNPVSRSGPPASFNNKLAPALAATTTAAALSADTPKRNSIAPTLEPTKPATPAPNIPLNKSTVSSTNTQVQQKPVSQTARPQQKQNIPARKPVSAPNTQKSQPRVSTLKPKTADPSRYGPAWGGAMGTMNESFEQFVRNKFLKGYN